MEVPTVSLTFYANQTECQSIGSDLDTEVLLWWFIAWCATIATLITVPYVCCFFQRRGFPSFDFEAAEAGDAEAAGDGLERAASSFRLAEKPSRDAQVEFFTDHAPNLEKAREHLRKSSPTDVNGRYMDAWSTKLSTMAELGGSSFELYFRLLVNLGFCFSMMSIFTSPLIIFNWNGNFLPDTGNSLAKTTIGNLGWIADADLAQEDRLVIIGCQGVDIKVLTAIYGKLNTIALLIFLLYVSYFRFRIVPRVASGCDDEALTVANYAVEIDCLPRDIPEQTNYAKLLEAHILDRIEVVREKARKGGCCKRRCVLRLPPAEVKELTLVRDYGKRLGSVKRRAKLLKAKDIATFKGNTAQVNKLEKKIKQVNAYLARKLKPEAQLPVLRAYAILGTVNDVGGLLMHYRFGNFKILRSWQSPDLRFQESPLRVRVAPEPSSILCENQDVPPWERRARQGITLLLWVVAVLMCGLLIMIVNYGASTQQEGASMQELGSATCDSGVVSSTSDSCSYQIAILWTKEEARTLGGEALDCYCLTKGYSNVLKDSELHSPTDGICKEWIYKTGRGVVIGVMVSGIVVVLNVVFRTAFIAFAEFERPLSVSALETSKMRKVFVSQFVNTGIIILLINYNSVIKIPPFGYGDFSDFERGWYAVVGGAMVMNMLLNAFLGSATCLASVIYKRFRRWRWEHRMKTQDELIELFTNPPFDISSRFAQLLMVVFCTMLFSSGMPILSIFAAVFCFLTYWTDKYVVLKFSRRPPIYDSALAKQAATILLAAVPMHAFFGIGVLGHVCTFPSNPLGGSLQSLSSRATSAASGMSGRNISGNSLLERATRESTWPLFVVLLFSVTLMILWLVLSIVGATFGEVLRILYSWCCVKNGSKVVPAASRSVGLTADDDLSWDNVKDRLARVCPPTSYRVEKNVAFAPYVQYLEMDPHASLVAEAPLAISGSDDDDPWAVSELMD